MAEKSRDRGRRLEELRDRPLPDWIETDTSRLEGDPNFEFTFDDGTKVTAEDMRRMREDLGEAPPQDPGDARS